MKVLIDKTFEWDVLKINEIGFQSKICECIINIQIASNPSKIKGLKNYEVFRHLIE